MRVLRGRNRCVDSRPAPPASQSLRSPSRSQRAAATAGTPTATPRSESEPPTPVDLTAELTWWDTSDATSEAPAYKELIAKSNEEYPKVRSSYETCRSTDAEEVQDRGSGRPGAPDILRAEVGWTPEFASGLPLDLDGTPALGQQDFLETPPVQQRYNDKTYGAPQVTRPSA